MVCACVCVQGGVGVTGKSGGVPYKSGIVCRPAVEEGGRGVAWFTFMAYNKKEKQARKEYAPSNNNVQGKA